MNYSTASSSSSGDTLPALPINIHEGFPYPADADPSSVRLVSGDYEYYHYTCDGTNDGGWGCGYRTLQTLCSWVRHQIINLGKEAKHVPSIPEIQQALVEMGDKPASFLNSKQWIGSVEVAMTVDYYYDVPCKIEHVSSGSDLKNHITQLQTHFESTGAPIMMGGDSDNSSKGIIGVCQGKSTDYLLILDPHFRENNPTQQVLAEQHYLSWYPMEKFYNCSFYNMCLPQFKKEFFKS